MPAHTPVRAGIKGTCAMKKTGVLASLLLLSGASLFALQETWAVASHGFGSLFEPADGQSAYSGYYTVGLGLYTFFEEWGGVFILFSLDGQTNPECLAGLAGKVPLSQQFTLYGGLGVNILDKYHFYEQELEGTALEYNKHTSHIGIGADLGLKFDVPIPKVQRVNNFFYIALGTTLSCFFTYHASIELSAHQKNAPQFTAPYEDKPDTYRMFGIRPYIAVGLNWHSGKTLTGRPPR